MKTLQNTLNTMEKTKYIYDLMLSEDYYGYNNTEKKTEEKAQKNIESETQKTKEKIMETIPEDNWTTINAALNGDSPF